MKGLVPGEDETGVRRAARALKLLEISAVLVGEPEITHDEGVLVLGPFEVREDPAGVVVQGVDVIDRISPMHAGAEFPDGEVRPGNHLPAVQRHLSWMSAFSEKGSGSGK